MFRFMAETFQRLIDELNITKTRYLYPYFKLSNRLTGLVGPRGVGKTTLLLQYIKNELFQEGRCFYFSADLVYFQKSTLLEFVRDLHRIEGYQIIFIDEIHKYANWNQELKNIYDSFPSLKIVFSGSSMLDLVQGTYELPVRAKLYRLHGLSFREYLNFILDENLNPIPFEKIIEETSLSMNNLKEIKRLLPYFADISKQGYYPFVFEDPHSYFEKVTSIIDKTIFEDIANYYNLKTPKPSIL